MSHTPEPTVVENGPLPEDRPIRRQIPSLRNRDVFAAVAAGKTHEEVANQFGLTQPRVTQIVQQVRDWSSQETRGDGSDYSDIQRLRLAEGTEREVEASLRDFLRISTRDAAVVGYVLVREWTSIGALLYVIRNFPRLWKKRRAIQSRFSSSRVADP